MAFPAGNQITDNWFNQLMNDVLNLQSYCTAVTSGTANSAAVSAQTVLNMASACVQLRSDIATVSANSALQTALVTYFQQQLGATGLQITTEFSTLNTLAGNIITALGTDYPHDAQGHLLDRTFSASTGITWITLTAAQLPNTMTAITAYLAEV
jgi:hypothetical protein